MFSFSPQLKETVVKPQLTDFERKDLDVHNCTPVSETADTSDRI